MTRDDLICTLEHLRACDEAVDWVGATPGTPEELWRVCPRGDWLLWLVRRTDALGRWAAVDIACRGFAPLAMDYVVGMRGWATRLRALAPITDEWTAQTARDLCRAANAAAKAAYAANAATAAYAATAATAAAYAAAANAATAATEAAAYAAAYAADAAAYAAWAEGSAREDALQQIAGIVRSRTAWADVERGIRQYV